MSLNTATVSGRLVRDPELRSLPSGDSVFENAIAVEEYVKDGENGVSFIDFKVYGGFADLLASKVEKGNLITALGRLKQETWEASDGTKRSKIVLIANDVEGEFKFKKASEAAAVVAQEGEKPSAQTDDIPF